MMRENKIDKSWSLGCGYFKGLTRFRWSFLLSSLLRKTKGGSDGSVPLHTLSCKAYTKITNTVCREDISDGLMKSLPRSPIFFSFSDWFKSQCSFVITRHGWPRKDFFQYFITDVNCWASTSYVVGKQFSLRTDSQILKLEPARALNVSKS